MERTGATGEGVATAGGDSVMGGGAGSGLAFAGRRGLDQGLLDLVGFIGGVREGSPCALALRFIGDVDGPCESLGALFATVCLIVS